MRTAPAAEGAPESAAEALQRRVLRPGAGAGALRAEYPLAFDPRLAGGRILTDADGGADVAGARAEGEGVVHSACALLPRTLVTPAGSLRVGLVGSVATDPDWRGRGLAGGLMERAAAELAGAGCVAALLWADDAGFYQRLGFEPVGAERDFLVDRVAAAGLPEVAARWARREERAALHALYLEHERRVERSAAESLALLGAPAMTTLVAERDGHPAAYACLGRGADFAGTIHEWAGEPALVLGLVRALRESSPTDLVVLAPPGAGPVPDGLAAAGAPESRGILGLARSLVPGRGAGELLPAEGPAAPFIWGLDSI